MDSDDDLELYGELTQVYVEDYYHTVQKWTLTRSAHKTLEALHQCPFLAAERSKLWTYDELYDVLTKWGHRRTRRGRNSLQVDLTNLWRCGLIFKFARGIYQRSGRPHGVHWQIRNE